MFNLDDRKWKMFMMAEIFKVDLSKGDNQPSLLEEGCYLQKGIFYFYG